MFVKTRDRGSEDPSRMLSALGVMNRSSLPGTEGAFLKGRMFSAQICKVLSKPGQGGHFVPTPWPPGVGMAIFSVAVILTSIVIWFQNLQLH